MERVSWYLGIPLFLISVQLIKTSLVYTPKLMFNDCRPKFTRRRCSTKAGKEYCARVKKKHENISRPTPSFWPSAIIWKTIYLSLVKTFRTKLFLKVCTFDIRAYSSLYWWLNGSWIEWIFRIRFREVKR